MLGRVRFARTRFPEVSAIGLALHLEDEAPLLKQVIQLEWIAVRQEFQRFPARQFAHAL